MQKLFKGYFLAKLKREIEKGTLTLPTKFPNGYVYNIWKNKQYQKNWVVYTKKPFSKVKNVVNYLGRYSHRVALTNHRIQHIDSEKGIVSFRYKDDKDGAKQKTMTLNGAEFLRRFCLHILPKGFRKVRSFGFLSNAAKAKALKIARNALAIKSKTLLTRKERKQLAMTRLFAEKTNLCPCCKKGKMVLVGSWERNKSPLGFFGIGVKKMIV